MLVVSVWAKAAGCPKPSNAASRATQNSDDLKPDDLKRDDSKRDMASSFHDLGGDWLEAR